MMDEAKLLYAESHEWADVHGEICTVGVSRFAVEQLTDITYIELPAVGKKLEAGKSFGVIESVKSANDLYAPVGGEVIEVNQRVANEPSSLSQDPYENGWMIKIKMSSAGDVARLKSKAAYDEQIAKEAH